MKTRPAPSRLALDYTIVCRYLLRVHPWLKLHFTFGNADRRLPARMMPAAFSQHVFLSPAQQKLMAQRVTVYSHHKIGQPPARTADPFLYTTPQEFDRQLSELNRGSYKVMPLEKALSNETGGKTVVITFDDAFRNVFEHGLEILARHKVPAIQFVVTGAIGKENHWDVEKGDVAEPLMDVAQIKQWLAAGNEIGSHSVTHRNLKKLSADDAREEIVASKKLLEDTFGVEVRHFCYPFGGWTPQVRELVIQAGYKTACSMDFGTNGSDADPFALCRIIPLSGRDLSRKIFHRLRRKFGMR